MRPAVASSFFFLSLGIAVLAGTPGIFQGEIYESAKPTPGWIYVRARNGMMRKVEISKARVSYAESVAAADRAADPAKDLVNGAEVQVTAEQDSAGDWRASRIEIVKVQPRSDQSGAQPGPRKLL